MAYGTPASPDDVEAYYTHIRRGRPPTPEQLADLRAPLRRHRRHLAARPSAPRPSAPRSQAALDERAPGRVRRSCSARSTRAPFIEDAVADARRRRRRRRRRPRARAALLRALRRRVPRAGAAAAGDTASTSPASSSWHLEPAYLDFLADASAPHAGRRCPPDTRCSSPPTRCPSGSLGRRPVPRRSSARAAAAVAARASGSTPWRGGRSPGRAPGRTPEPWRGPDILEVIRDLAGTGRADGVLVCPRGFVADHLEVLYDLDIEAPAVAAEARARLRPHRVSTTTPPCIAALAARVRRRAGRR